MPTLAELGDGTLLTGIGMVIAALFTGLGAVLGRYFTFRTQMERIALKHTQGLLERVTTLTGGLERCIRAVVNLNRDCRDRYMQQRTVIITLRNIIQRQNELGAKVGLEPCEIPDVPSEQEVSYEALEEAESFLREAAQIAILMNEAGNNTINDLRTNRLPRGDE